MLPEFHLFSPTPSMVGSFIVKNQARLTRKIVGSYSRVFTVLNHFILGMLYCQNSNVTDCGFLDLLKITCFLVIMIIFKR